MLVWFGNTHVQQVFFKEDCCWCFYLVEEHKCPYLYFSICTCLSQEIAYCTRQLSPEEWFLLEYSYNSILILGCWGRNVYLNGGKFSVWSWLFLSSGIDVPLHLFLYSHSPHTFINHVCNFGKYFSKRLIELWDVFVVNQ